MAEAENDESSVRWLISYADYMMQLVCLFILLYATSTPNAEMRKLVASGRREEIGEEPRTNIRPNKGANLPSTDFVQWNEGSKRIFGRDPRNKNRPRITISNIERGAKIELENVEIFAEGKAELTEDAKGLLATVRDSILRSMANKVTIIGHTSNNPEDSIDGDKWLLSYKRAKVAADLLTDTGATYYIIHPSRVKIEEMANYEPREDESNQATIGQARKANRRIDILVEGYTYR